MTILLFLSSLVSAWSAGTWAGWCIMDPEHETFSSRRKGCELIGAVTLTICLMVMTIASASRDSQTAMKPAPAEQEAGR